MPPLLTQLIRGIDNTRSSLSRLCVDTARHLSTGGANDPGELSEAVDKALDPQFRAGIQGLINPYGDGRASARVVRAIVDLMHVPRPSKEFVDR